jgi:hypothetical protein
MTLFLVIFLCTISELAADEQPKNPAKAPELARYWYGDPPKEGTASEVQAYMPKWALQTLDKNERAALEKLKAVGFVVHEHRHFQHVTKDGKRIVTPPTGIVLWSPNVNVPKAKAPELTPKDLAPLADLRHVKTLELAGKFVSDDTVDLLLNMEELADLTMLHTGITNNGLKKLARLKKLRRFTSDSPAITDAGFATLAALPALEAIQLTESHVTDAGIAAFAGHVNLRELWLRPPLSPLVVDDKGKARFATEDEKGLKITDQGLAVLGTLPELERLTLTKCRISARGLAGMAKPGNCAKLFTLGLSGTEISDAELKLLHDPKSLPSLIFFNIEQTKVTREGVVALQNARRGLQISAAFPGGGRYDTRINGIK